MPRFSKHYTIEEASALLPQIRNWFVKLEEINKEINPLEKQLRRLVATGYDTGGEMVTRLVRRQADSRDLFQEFVKREIQVKDLERGLIDFPSYRQGKEIFLCWEKEEDNIEFWHSIDCGFSDRERL